MAYPERIKGSSCCDISKERQKECLRVSKRSKLGDFTDNKQSPGWGSDFTLGDYWLFIRSSVVIVHIMSGVHVIPGVLGGVVVISSQGPV